MLTPPRLFAICLPLLSLLTGELREFNAGAAASDPSKLSLLFKLSVNSCYYDGGWLAPRHRDTHLALHECIQITPGGREEAGHPSPSTVIV